MDETLRDRLDRVMRQRDEARKAHIDALCRIERYIIAQDKAEHERDEARLDAERGWVKAEQLKAERDRETARANQNADERDEALLLLREVIASAVTFADARVRYVEVQIDLPTFYAIKSALDKRDA